MRIFLTGATGFVGSHLVKLLLDHGHHVAALLRPEGNPRRITSLLSRLTPIHGLLAEPDALASALISFRPETVLHLGWNGVGNRERNADSQAANIDEARKLMELARRVGIRAWIGLGSQAEYGPCPAVIDESHPCAPTTLYGRAKLEVCRMAAETCAAAGMRFVWLRLFSSYGPDDHDHWMIPYLILSLLRGERPSLTAAEQMWDYLYVGDAVAAVAAVAEAPAVEGVFNLGSGTAYQLRTVIETVRDLIDPALPLGFGEVAYRPDQVMHLEANVTKLRASTSWRAHMPLAQGLRQTVEWYRANASHRTP